MVLKMAKAANLGINDSTLFEYLEIFRFTCLLNGGHCDLIKKGCKFTI